MVHVWFLMRAKLSSIYMLIQEDVFFVAFSMGFCSIALLNSFHIYLLGNYLIEIYEISSARDVNEVAQCVKDLNSPSYHPSMVSLWVSDSFERKDTERNLLGKLLVKLAKSQGGILTPPQLIEG